MNVQQAQQIAAQSESSGNIRPTAMAGSGGTPGAPDPATAQMQPANLIYNPYMAAAIARPLFSAGVPATAAGALTSGVPPAMLNKAYTTSIFNRTAAAPPMPAAFVIINQLPYSYSV